MKRTTAQRATGLAALALTASFGLAACGSDDSSNAASDTGSKSPSMSQSSDSATDAGAQTFGPGCASVPTSGDGSFDGMSTAPVASAASANPLLKTLVTAVTKAGLVDTLNSADALTVFAPTNDAFAKIPAKDLNAVLTDKATLTKILTHHVIAGQLGPGPDRRHPRHARQDQVTVLRRHQRHDGRRREGALRQHPDRQRHRLRHRLRPDAA